MVGHDPKVLLTSNGALVPNQVLFVTSRKMLIQHRVETTSLVLVSVHAILDVLRSITREVICKLTVSLAHYKPLNQSVPNDFQLFGPYSSDCFLVM